MPRQRTSPVSMAGLSIAGPTAAPWITDFLNAAFYAKPTDARSLDDLRLAWTIVRTYWNRHGHRRLTARDLVRFHRAFGQARLEAREAGDLGRLSSTDLLQGADSLVGPWFVRGWETPSLRGFGIVFEDNGERRAFRPEARLRHAALGDLTPPSAPPGERTWHTYPPVPVRSAEQTLGLLRDASRWPDVSSALGQFTPLRSGGLLGQTFEIELAVGNVPRAPLFVRSYVTATRVLDPGSELRDWAAELDRGLRASDAVSAALPQTAEPLFGLELTTHSGHFIGAAISNLLLFRSGTRAFLCDTGCWDPMPAHLAIAYKTVGAAAQEAFWGPAEPENSMLAQMASFG